MEMTDSERRIARTHYKEWGERLIGKAAQLARDIGRSVSDRYGPKYDLCLAYGPDGKVVQVERTEQYKLRVYVDDYGGYATAYEEGKRVCSSHFCEQTALPGDWSGLLDKAFGSLPSHLGEGI